MPACRFLFILYLCCMHLCICYCICIGQSWKNLTSLQIWPVNVSQFSISTPLNSRLAWWALKDIHVWKYLHTPVGMSRAGIISAGIFAVGKFTAGIFTGGIFSAGTFTTGIFTDAISRYIWGMNPHKIDSKIHLYILLLPFYCAVYRLGQAKDSI